jgi:hypothetical protein
VVEAAAASNVRQCGLRQDQRPAELAFFFGERIELNPISRWPGVEHLS